MSFVASKGTPLTIIFVHLRRSALGCCSIAVLSLLGCIRSSSSKCHTQRMPVSTNPCTLFSALFTPSAPLEPMNSYPILSCASGHLGLDFVCPGKGERRLMREDLRQMFLGHCETRSASASASSMTCSCTRRCRAHMDGLTLVIGTKP